MLNSKILKTRFWTTNYPNLDSSLEGVAIPIAWGKITGAPAFCIDTQAFKFKLIETQGRGIKSIDKIVGGIETLTEGIDYETDLINAEFTIFGTPKLQGNTTYYFVIESDYTIDGTNYLRFAQKPYDFYSDGQLFYIDDQGNWSGQLADLFFKIYARDSIGGEEFELVNNFDVDWEGWNMEAKLRDVAAHTRLAQSFLTPAGGPFYLSRIILAVGIEGNPSSSRTTRMSILSSYQPETQVGAKSYRLENQQPSWGDAPFAFPQRAEVNNLSVDFQSYEENDQLIENVADIIKDCYINVMGGSEAGLDLDSLNDLKTARPEALSIYIKDEITFREFIDKLEIGQRFKFLAGLNQKFLVSYAKPSSEWPADTIHFRDEDFIEGSFKCRKLWKAVYHKIKLKYSEDPISNEWLIKEIIENLTKYAYRNEKTLTVETYFSNSTDAQSYAETYGSSLCQPPLIIEFESMAAKGFNLIPWQGIYVTRQRALSIEGKFEKKAFRILSIQKNPLSGIISITAIENEPTI